MNFQIEVITVVNDDKVNILYALLDNIKEIDKSISKLFKSNRNY